MDHPKMTENQKIFYDGLDEAFEACSNDKHRVLNALSLYRNYILVNRKSKQALAYKQLTEKEVLEVINDYTLPY